MKKTRDDKRRKGNTKRNKWTQPPKTYAFSCSVALGVLGGCLPVSAQGLAFP